MNSKYRGSFYSELTILGPLRSGVSEAGRSAVNLKPEQNDLSLQHICKYLVIDTSSKSHHFSYGFFMWISYFSQDFLPSNRALPEMPQMEALLFYLWTQANLSPCASKDAKYLKLLSYSSSHQVLNFFNLLLTSNKILRYFTRKKAALHSRVNCHTQ